MKNVGHEPLEWSEALATGVREIDRQHRILISILNEANTLSLQPDSRESLGKLVGELASYTIYHFDTEEELMENSGYGATHPEEEETHFREHRSFSTQVSGIQQDILNGRPIAREALFGFLNNWLVNHVLGTDRKLGRFLTDAGRS